MSAAPPPPSYEQATAGEAQFPTFPPPVNDTYNTQYNTQYDSDQNTDGPATLLQSTLVPPSATTLYNLEPDPASSRSREECPAEASSAFSDNTVRIIFIRKTICLSIVAGIISSYCDTKSVLIAFGISDGVCLGMTIFLIQTKYDCTIYGSVVYTCLLVVVLSGFTFIFTYNDILQAVYGAIGALLLSGFFAYDTQQIVDGKRGEIGPEDYIFAALNIYTDIVHIFPDLFRVIGCL
ncbi:protein lifeguard 1-like [Saccoglossus kowalevskii]